MGMQWDTTSVLRSRIRRKVSLAVLVLDDFTGKPITTPDLTVSASETLEKPIRKGDGYFLFMDFPGSTLTVTAGGWTYHSTTAAAELADLPPLRPVMILRLTPNRNYAIPTHTTCLEGRAPARAQVRVYCTNDPRPLRLLYDYDKKAGKFLQLFDQSQSNLEGRTFALMRKDQEKPEYFTVQERMEEQEGGWRLAAPLSANCKKAGTSIYPVFLAQADEQGNFFLPLPVIAAKDYECCLVLGLTDGTCVEQKIRLEAGRVTRMDVTNPE